MSPRQVFVAGLLGAGLFVGCNAILGTEDPILDPAEGATSSTSATGTTTSTGTGGGATTSTTSSTSTASAGGTGGAGGSGSTTTSSTSGSGGNCDITTDPEWAHWLPAAANSYTASSDTVTDAKTGLVWQRTLSNMSYTYDEAAVYCDGIAFDGFDDWRVPTRIEMVSITDYTKNNPALDATAFPATPLADFWTSTSYPPDATQAYRIYAGTGVSQPDPKTTKNAVRCVRP